MEDSRINDGIVAVSPRKRNRGRLAFGLAALAIFGVGASSLTVGCGGNSDDPLSVGLPTGKATMDQVERGRVLVTSSGCGDCHSGGSSNPASANWLSGYHTGDGPGVFQLGPSTTVYAANISPDGPTGIGMHSDQEIYNVLKFGYDPESPAGGPQQYVAPVMPWASFRHKSDEDLWAIVAYLKHGAGAVSNAVPENVGVPPDNWAAASSEAAVGPATTPSFPTGAEHFNP